MGSLPKTNSKFAPENDTGWDNGDRHVPHLAVLDTEKKIERFFFPKYVIPKSLKFSHWLSEWDGGWISWISYHKQ